MPPEEDQETIYEIFVDIRDLLRDINLGVGAPIKPGDYLERVSETDVTIEPGKSKTILSVSKIPGYLWEVGVNDETYSTYHLYIDGTELGNPVPQPWGLYNDPYRFPQPIVVGNSIDVVVDRHSDAPASAGYYAKIRMVKSW